MAFSSCVPGGLWAAARRRSSIGTALLREFFEPSESAPGSRHEHRPSLPVDRRQSYGMRANRRGGKKEGCVEKFERIVVEGWMNGTRNDGLAMVLNH
ncbi:hypothetical protein HPB51_017316 [Rhipicephalus microplus]|uniref:Uncharacterized protein n=1 Tax=Rhipicephalus microplus TaxID=6941 RepID=A0A9J6EUN8_RHIMP|nr:hypothetical protein HPB51_017316 [Rhipicephalus microplus]